MTRTMQVTVLMAGLLIGGVCFGQAASTAPTGSTGVCNDGTYWSGQTKRGACHGHKGIKQWFGAASDSPAATSATPATPATSGSASTPTAPAATAPPTPTTSAPTSKAAAPPVAAAPGGGPGLVWVNTSSKVYHCPSDRWYGKTKNGKYMSEADAAAQGNHPDHGKACH
jgi:hypothetical protein